MKAREKLAFFLLAAAACAALDWTAEAWRSRDGGVLELLAGHGWWKTETDEAFAKEIAALPFGLPLKDAIGRYRLAVEGEGPVYRSQARKADFIFGPDGTMTGFRAIHVLDGKTTSAAFMERLDAAVLALDASAKIENVPSRLSANCARDAARFPTLCDGSTVLHLYSGEKIEGRIAAAPSLEDSTVIEAAAEFSLRR